MFLAVILLWIFFAVYLEKDRLAAYLKAVTAWTLYMFIITEILSFFKALGFAGLMASWVMLDGLLMWIIITGKGLKREKLIIFRKDFICKFKQLRGYYIVLPAISLLSIYFAVRTVPYNFDSMTYHLSRVAHWAQNRSISHYSTNIIRQAASPVLAEFVVLQVYILCRGNDIFVNLLQSLSFCTNAVVVYGIAKKLGGRKGYCFLAGFLFMTTPIAFAESATTQVDNFAALWMLIFTYFIIDLVKINKNIIYDKNTVGHVVVLGLNVAFGYLCKPSVSIAMAVFALWLLVISIIRKDKMAHIGKLICWASPMVFIPVAVEAGRNIRTFGGISAPIAGSQQLIGTLKPSYVLVNCVKNITFNLPNIYDRNSQVNIERFVHKLSDILRVEIDDPGISEKGLAFMVHPAQMYEIDSAVNPVIVFLTLLCVIWLICTCRHRKFSDAATGFSVISIFSFFLFCALLRWEAFVSRYMISYFALLCVTVCIQLQSLEEYISKAFAGAMAGIICFCSIVDFYGLIIYNKEICDRTNSVSREEGYFTGRHSIYEDYATAARYIRENGYKNIGLLCYENYYEYPFIKMIEDDIDRFEHVGVRNSTAMYDDGFIPECIFALRQPIEEEYIYHDTIYRIAYDYDEENRYILTRASSKIYDNVIRNDNHMEVELDNFYKLEDWGRWTKGNQCEVYLYGNRFENFEGYISACIYMNSFVDRQTVHVLVNDKDIATVEVTQNREYYIVPINADILEPEENKLTLRLEGDVYSPDEMGQSSDPRELGLAIESLSIIAGE